MTRANELTGDKPPDRPERTSDRDERRAAALRANLQRRKAQLRGRKAEQNTDGDYTKDER